MSEDYGFGDDPQPVTITVTRGTLTAALACLEGCSTDRREPERYRQWYSRSLAEMQAVAGEIP